MTADECVRRIREVVKDWRENLFLDPERLMTEVAAILAEPIAPAPLTEAQRQHLFEEWWITPENFHAFVQAVERAHGIGITASEASNG